MADFPFVATVIVPVYNVEKYLDSCMQSLIEQTIEFSSLEILLIDDGSKDSSAEICRGYSEKYPNVRFFTKENEGLSKTRNFGLKRAAGKYIFYLDSDDTLAPETIKSVTDYFDKVYDTVDMVTYRITQYFEGQPSVYHFRYRTLRRTGIYDLNDIKNAFITQTNINICVKNEGEKNILFDESPDFRHEDEKYCCDILMRKMKIGFCGSGEYRYNRNNTESIVSTLFSPYYIFETSMEFYENLFNSFSGRVPPYFQGIVFNDLRWKLKEDKLLPYHYPPNEFKKAQERIDNLLRRIDADTIILHPSVNEYHIHYWLSRKPDCFPTVLTSKGGVCVAVDGKKIFSASSFPVMMRKIFVENGRARLLFFIKSPVFNHLERGDYEIIAEDNGRRTTLDSFTSIFSAQDSVEYTAAFPAAFYEWNAGETHSIKFFVRIRSEEYPTELLAEPTAVFSRKIHWYIRGNTKFTRSGRSLHSEPVTAEQTREAELKQSKNFGGKIKKLRREAINYRSKHRIWLYYDLHTVDFDNGYYQFKNDIKHTDGVERYYVYSREYENMDELFTKEEQAHLVKFGSEKHRLLYLSCELIFTAFYGVTPVSPFGSAAGEVPYADLLRFKTIYLQHGVLHAALRSQNSVERCRADKIVISAPFEKRNYMENYHYPEDNLIPTGMARYDHIDKSRSPKNRILFAPSWRKYLTQEINSSKWELVEGRLKNSDYFKNFSSFLENPRLHALLEREDMYLDLKLHPIIAGAKGLFDIKSPRIKLAGAHVDVEDYKVFITDFSSFVFDFAYLSRPVIYFVPDYGQFKAGMNHYRELDLPFEEAFGPLTLDPDAAVAELEKAAGSGFEPESVYKERMDNFYYPLENCAEGLWEYAKKRL